LRLVAGPGTKTERPQSHNESKERKKANEGFCDEGLFLGRRKRNLLHEQKKDRPRMALVAHAQGDIKEP